MTPADPYLVTVAASKLRNRPEDAMDTVQEVWLRLLKDGRDFRSWDDARVFSLVVLLNLVRDRYRREHHHVTVYLEEWSAEYHDHYPAVECADWFSTLPKLTERERRIAGLTAAGYSPD